MAKKTDPKVKGRSRARKPAEETPKNPELVKLLLSLIPLVLAGLLYLLAHASRPFAEWYATALYPLWVGLFGRLFSWLPFSVSEILLYLLVFWVIFGIVRAIVRLVKNEKPFNKGFMPWLRSWILLIGCVALAFMLGGGINYNRAPFSEVAAFSTENSSKEDLYALTKQLAESVKHWSGLTERDDRTGLCLAGEDMEGRAAAAMEKLGEVYPSMKGYYPKPKRVFWSDFLSYQHISGVFSPFTVEAHYNKAMVPYNYGFTVCHELSHLRGFMREDEANFIAFLGCTNSSDAYFNYSGYLLGFIYASNALYAEDRDLWREVYAILPEEAVYDLNQNSEFWARYETKVAEVAGQVNDTYLKANGQETGVKSYGHIVDLLIAYYKSQGKI